MFKLSLLFVGKLFWCHIELSGEEEISADVKKLLFQVQAQNPDYFLSHRKRDGLDLAGRQDGDEAVEELGPVFGLELDDRRVEVVQKVSGVSLSRGLTFREN